MLSVLALILIVVPQPLKSVSDPTAAGKITKLFHAVFATDNEREESLATSEVKAIYTRRGLPTITEVGDEPAYEFILLLANDRFPLSFRQQVLAKIKEAAARHEIPSDAPIFYAARLRMSEAKQKAESSPPTNLALRDQIKRMYKADQGVRQKNSFDPEELVKVDQSHTAPLQAIFRKYGLPTYSLVGPQAADEFLIMIQHQPAHFRAQVLPNLKAAVDAGQADAETYALVYDRAQRDMGRKQLYGTQFECKQGEKLHPAPTEDEAHVNQRRAQMGHMRVELYARLLAETTPQFCSPASTKAGARR
ncbi:MAG: DUF6624 domain-containing protein [Chlamydiota bacterium]